MAQALFEVVDLNKSFHGTHALKGVTFDVQPGEFHALLGENGAGKSTLIKVSTGVYRADSGEIRWRGETVSPRSPLEAQQLGIGVVYQESSLIPGLSVAENFALGREPAGLAGWVRWAAVAESVRRHAARLQFDVDPATPVFKLSVAEQKWIDILKTLATDPDLIILDEPTAALTVDETERLLELLKTLKMQGKAILYVTHRLQEIGQLVDRVSVLKDGSLVATLAAAEATTQRIVSLMVGREIAEIYPPAGQRVGPELLRVEAFTRRGAFQQVELTVNRGEIVGLVGLQGHGHFEVARSLFGVPPCPGGRLYLKGRPVNISGPLAAFRHGIGFVSDDRVRDSVLPGLTVRENLTLSALRGLAKLGVVRSRREEEEARRLIDWLSIKTSSPEAPIDALSGGNQQKVALARWLAADVELLVLLDPTAGVDVGSRVEIYRILRGLADEGGGVVVATSDLAEALGLCDRVYAFYRGRVSGHFRRGELHEAAVLAAMTGHAQEAV